MNRRTLTIAAIIGAVFWLGVYEAAAHANTTAKAPKPDPAPVIWPEGPCNLEHRMDIAIVDGLFFECQCLRLQTGYVCDWYLVAGVDTVAWKRRIKRHPKGWHLAAPALSRVPA